MAIVAGYRVKFSDHQGDVRRHIGARQRLPIALSAGAAGLRPHSMRRRSGAEQSRPWSGSNRHNRVTGVPGSGPTDRPGPADCKRPRHRRRHRRALSGSQCGVQDRRRGERSYHDECRRLLLPAGAVRCLHRSRTGFEQRKRGLRRGRAPDDTVSVPPSTTIDFVAYAIN